jgi:hypothetical protein
MGWGNCANYFAEKSPVLVRILWVLQRMGGLTGLRVDTVERLVTALGNRFVKS